MSTLNVQGWYAKTSGNLGLEMKIKPNSNNWKKKKKSYPRRTNLRKSPCVSENGEEIWGRAPVLLPFSHWVLIWPIGVLFEVVVSNMATHRQYPYLLNFNFLLLLLFYCPTETQWLATEASCAHPLIGPLPPARGSRVQTHTKNGQTTAEVRGHGRRPDKWGEKTEERYWSRRMSQPKQSKSDWVTTRMSAKRIVGKARWQGSGGGQIKGKEEWSPPCRV